MFESLDLLSWFALVLAVVTLVVLGGASLFAVWQLFFGGD